MKKTKIVLQLALASPIIFFSTASIAESCQPVVWEDNFTQASLDSSAWEVQTGDGCDQGAGMCGWGNSELQNYQADNISLANGILTIEARKQRIKSTQYTSGRIRTANMPNSGEWAFGRFEARMKFPDGQGMWPAFWMLPTNPTQGWPMSGEIDIFESVGQSANTAYGTIHYGQPWPDNAHQGGQIIMQPGKWSDGFHTYAVEWEQDEIRWYVDNMLYSVKTASDVAPEDWPFDGRNNFHFILNLAVGGTWGGSVDDSVLPQQMQVDFVRVLGGNQPGFTGNHLPAPGSTETYEIVNGGNSISWGVIGGVISGTGSSIQVTWDASSAGTTQSLSANVDGCEVSTNIYVGKNLSTETVLEDFNGTTNMTITSSNGVADTSGGTLKYTRDSASQWDVIAATTSAISDAGAFISGEKMFEMDINNTNPSLVGKEILIQLENSSVATPDNFPGGRHSKYQAFIDHDSGWKTVRFSLLERLDTATSDTSVDNFLVLIDPNSFNNDQYELDNIHILGTGGTPENQLPTAGFSVNCDQLNCQLDASASSDPDGNIVSYSWELGDGNFATGINPAHLYAASGAYTVTLTVEDNDGGVTQTSQEILVSQDTGEATASVVNSLSTSTQGAGRGQKYGVATVTITDNLGSPIAGASVTGNFSGSWNEPGSAITDEQGIATIVTTTALSGGVTVKFCVTTVNTSLPLDSNNSVGLCQ